MMYRSLGLAIATICLCASSPLSANDARAIALGGTALANGQGVHGAWVNPASLLQAKRQNQSFHGLLGIVGDFRDPGELVQTAIDNDTLESDITNNIDDLSDRPIECNVQNLSDDAVCLSGTEALANDFDRVVDIANSITEQPVEFQANFKAGFAHSGVRFPFALHFAQTYSAAGEVNTSDNDLAYLTLLRDVLSDDQLTFGEITDSVIEGQQILSIDENTQSDLNIVQPEDVLTSEYRGTGIERQQFGISFGHSFTVSGKTLDVGTTAKFSSITTYRAEGSIAGEFDETTASITDDFEDAETTTSSFTLDVGATYAASDQLAVSAVIKNLIPESADTNLSSVSFDTTPQLLVGAAYQLSRVTINADLALNEAEQDGFKSQPMGIGAEFNTRFVALRGGVSIDNSRRSDKAAVTLGLGLGPLQIGTRVSSVNAIQAGAQLSYSF